jgi:hypothetical protein
MDFTRKARFVAGGHMTDPPSDIMYSSVVSPDSVRIAFLLAALNNVDILAMDIGNAYLNASPREKVYTTAGPEFGAELEGKPVLIVRALYGLKSSGAAWRSHLANTLHNLGFTSNLADPDVWLHAEVKEWRFPEDSERIRWALSSEQYIKEAIMNIETHLKRYGRTLNKAKQPMVSYYRPELDITPLLQDDDINFYQSQISILRWMVELGRLDIYVNVAMLSSYFVQPRQGHLEAVYNIYGYLKAQRRSTMVFNDAYLNWQDEDFPQYDWADFYRDATEDIPPNAPPPRGMPVQLNVFVDADHAGNKIT